jgi:NADPH-dependent curcumin reductase CurA
MKSRQIVLASRPKGLPKSENFRIEDYEVGNLKTDELLLKPWFISVDPYMRGRMNEAKSYAASFQLDQAIRGGVVAEVIESNNKGFSAGDFVVGNLPWAEYCIEQSSNLRKVDTNSFPPGFHLGVLGMPGMTAYFGMKDIIKPKKSETVVISGAAGAVGIVAGQIARIHGAMVVGITGSDEKCKLLKENFNFDVALNYKKSKNLRKDISIACPNGVDGYFDNVGGEITDAVINNLNSHSRIALCGQIAHYNATRIPTGPTILPVLLTRSVMLQGFLVSNYSGRFGEALSDLTNWVKDGKIKYTETVVKGFENLPEAFIGLFSGKNQGKMLVEV